MVEDARARGGRRLRRRLQGRRLRRARTGSIDCVRRQRGRRRRLRPRRRHGVAVRPPGAPRRFDLLFVDEAGQFSLANAAAVALAADSVVLLGDPQQLPQVTQADAPGGSRARRCSSTCSTGASTVAADRGVLPDRVLAHAPGRLRASSPSAATTAGCARAPACAARRVDARRRRSSGAGLRIARGRARGPQPELGRGGRARSPRPAARCSSGGTRDRRRRRRRARCAPRTSWSSRPTTWPCAASASTSPIDVRVGTVDRFQGQEAPVVFFAMTCSVGRGRPARARLPLRPHTA